MKNGQNLSAVCSEPKILTPQVPNIGNCLVVLVIRQKCQHLQSDGVLQATTPPLDPL